MDKKRNTTLLSHKAQKKPVRHKDTVSKPVVEKEDVSLFDKVIKESEEWTPGKGHKRVFARMAYFLWLTLPVRYRGAPESVRSALGLSGDMYELAGVTNVKDFGRTFDIGHQVLAEWGKEYHESDEGHDTRALFRGLMKEALGAVYRKLIEQGDAERFKTFAAYVEGWSPSAQPPPPSDIERLSDEEKTALDRMLEKNTHEAM